MMFIQSSYQSQTAGTLYVIPTTIRNLEDITFRAIRILNEVDMIAAEDTRHTRKLLNHYHIKRPLVSYHEHNEKERTAELIHRLKNEGTIALVSDAGMLLFQIRGMNSSK